MENGKRKRENAVGEKYRFAPSFVYFLSTVIRRSFSIFHFPFSVFIVCLFLAACASLEKPKPEPFYSDAAPPSPQKEFRWSNGGKLPASFDPAFAAAAPEIDVVRALYEGLTDTDARTLKTVPAIAVDWSTSDDNRTWTFKLRRDARWSNGERVTAGDFARSWKRLAALDAKVPHFNLLTNIVGVRTAKNQTDAITGVSDNQTAAELFLQRNASRNLSPIFGHNGVNRPKTETNRQTEATPQPESETNSTDETKLAPENHTANETKPPVKTETAFGAVVVDDFTLKVSLVKPDKDFPALVAHPVFRPVFADGKNLGAGKLNQDIVTSGAFRLLSVSQTDGVTLQRSEIFWNKNQIEIERVRFVPTENAERALEAYRAGAIDAVTNAEFEPLALKLLTPFDDFRRMPHSALNFYEFNRDKAPFDDRRVREALAISVERERLTQDELDGASIPALNFLPFGDEKNLSLSQNVERARNLLSAAGFAGGEDFPVVKLVVNRNNVQQRIARAVAKMWKQNLNVETEIVVKEPAEIERARNTGDFDVLRRGVLLPTTDETMNMQAIFARKNQSKNASPDENLTDKTAKENKNAAEMNSQSKEDSTLAENAGEQSGETETPTEADAAKTSIENASREILTEADALGEFAAVPLYFPTSYSLVKPYVRGFVMNSLDAPSLKDVRIDNDRQPKTAKSES